MDYEAELKRMTERRDRFEKKVKLYECLSTDLYHTEIELCKKAVEYLDAKIERLSEARN